MQLPRNIPLHLGLIYLMMVLLAVLIVYKVALLQFDDGLKEKATKISYRNEELSAKRGDILAHDGRLLVTSLPQYQLYMDCLLPDEAVFNSGVKGLSVALSGFFKDKTAAGYEKILRDGRAKKRRYVKLGNRLIKHAELEKVYQFPIFKQGWRERVYEQNKGGGIFEVRNVRTASYDKLA
ncbi:MAG: hypothetical protein LBD52_05880, partial [Prevotellaceae bacterium]|nr:hypothetical protein [Prevotellaceae bacterium]